MLGTFSWSLENYGKVLSSSSSVTQLKFYLPLKYYALFSKGVSRCNKEREVVALTRLMARDIERTEWR